MYTETPGQTLHNTPINYNQAVADIVETEVGGLPIEIFELGAVITTAFVTSTSLVFSLFIKDADRATETEDILTLTIPNGAAAGKVYYNRTDNPTKALPGGTFTIAAKTQGVGSAGACKPYVLWRYAPTGRAATEIALTE